MKCPVCDYTITTEKVCPNCGFSDFQTEFISEEDALFWKNEIVGRYKRSLQEKQPAEEIVSATNTCDNSIREKNAPQTSKRKRHLFAIVISAALLITLVVLSWNQYMVPWLHENKYIEAKEYISNGNYGSAISLLDELGEYKDAQELSGYASYLQEYSQIQDSTVGDIVYFGSYAGNQVTWRILDKNENTALLISEYVIDAQPYNQTAA